MSDHEKIRCWSCGTFISLDEHSEADGDCPHCNAEIDLEDYLRQAMKKVQELLCRIDELKAGHGESVAWQFLDHDGKWYTGSDRNNHRQNTEEAGYQIRELFAAPPASSGAVPVPREVLAAAVGHPATTDEMLKKIVAKEEPRALLAQSQEVKL